MLGMMIANVPAARLGEGIAGRMRERLVHAVAAAHSCGVGHRHPAGGERLGFQERLIMRGDACLALPGVT